MPYRLATAQQNPRMVRIVKRRAGDACRELPPASRWDILAGHRPLYASHLPINNGVDTVENTTDFQPVNALLG